MCLLLPKPASLHQLLVDDLVEVPPQSHGWNAERSGATSEALVHLVAHPVGISRLLIISTTPTGSQDSVAV